MDRLRRWFFFLIGLILGAAAAPAPVHAAELGMVAAFNLASCPENWTTFASGAGRFVVGAGGSQAYALGATGGADLVALSVAEMPAHTHTATFAGDNLVIYQRGGGAGVYGAAGGSIFDRVPFVSNSTGGGAAHENRPPYIALLLCERTTEDDGGSVAFWPEMTMEEAMEVGAAIMVLFALAWGIGVVLRNTLFNR